MTFDFNKEFERMILKHDLDTVIIPAHMNPDGDAAATIVIDHHAGSSGSVVTWS